MSRIISARRPAICPPAIAPHRLQHDRFEDAAVEVDGASAVVKRIVTQTPLDRYIARKLIDRRQFEAGERLSRDWQFARMEPRMIASYRDLIDCGGMPDPAVDRAHARKRVARAVAAVGPIASSEVVSVCCLERPVGGNVAMEILRRGLDVLADHYGV
ncbi:MAG: hypothetical protein IT562_11070 [Alphaproteobacteria bacterium]|nr:hypothetical protein [Alphaproteobacteria bacterium]